MGDMQSAALNEEVLERRGGGCKGVFYFTEEYRNNKTLLERRRKFLDKLAEKGILEFRIAKEFYGIGSKMVTEGLLAEKYKLNNSRRASVMANAVLRCFYPEIKVNKPAQNRARVLRTAAIKKCPELERLIPRQPQSMSEERSRIRKEILKSVKERAFCLLDSRLQEVLKLTFVLETKTRRTKPKFRSAREVAVILEIKLREIYILRNEAFRELRIRGYDL